MDRQGWDLTAAGIIELAGPCHFRRDLCPESEESHEKDVSRETLVVEA